MATRVRSRRTVTDTTWKVFPVGAWTGRELVLYSSGINPGDDKPYPESLARAAAYDPATDSWRRIAPLPASGRGFGGAAAWDGREVLVVGDGATLRGMEDASSDLVLSFTVFQHIPRVELIEGGGLPFVGERVIGLTYESGARDDRTKRNTKAQF